MEEEDYEDEDKENNYLSNYPDQSCTVVQEGPESLNY